MLFLLFHLDNDCYALDASQVAEVLPLVNIKKMLRSPRGVVGTINYHGTFVPVVDLSEMALGHRSPSRLSTRIILVRCSKEGQPNLLGLVAERATETMWCERADFGSSGVKNDDATYLGAVIMRPRGLVQLVELNKLLPAPLANLVSPQQAQYP